MRCARTTTVVLLAVSTVLAGVACWEKEAADPQDVLKDDIGSEEPDASAGEPPGKSKGASSTEPLASRIDCEQAQRHLFELGYKQEGGDTPDLDSDEARTKIEKLVDECLKRRTTRREAWCISRVAREADIDRCVQKP
ncbi:MAG TPA: hypothetical protein VGJ84_12190 [Polyangiaceae bacterium]